MITKHRMMRSTFKSVWPFRRSSAEGRGVRSIPIRSILLGGENDLPGYQYALMADDLMRPSRPVELGPHAKLLREFDEIGFDVLKPSIFETTDYYKNALQCIDIFGDYFPGITTAASISLAAERFLKLRVGQSVDHLPSAGHSPEGEPITVVPLAESDCYQLVQGNHRVAFAVASGQESISARVLEDRTEKTPIQFLLELLRWEQGEKVLYQPLPCRELEASWTQARRCTDRFEKMLHFLQKRVPDSSTVLDIGSYYGWFVSEFRRRDYDAFGIEKDNVAIKIGSIAYGNLDGAIIRDDAQRFLLRGGGSYDVVLCLSVFHHFLTGREGCSPDVFLRLLDQCTKKVLFFEVGGPHEAWFRDALRDWPEERTTEWIKATCSFRECVFLGRDDDGRGNFSGNFGRALYAFIK